jgi:hypothetical protein
MSAVIKPVIGTAIVVSREALGKLLSNFGAETTFGMQLTVDRPGRGEITLITIH